MRESAESGRDRFLSDRQPRRLKVNIFSLFSEADLRETEFYFSRLPPCNNQETYKKTATATIPVLSRRDSWPAFPSLSGIMTHAHGKFEFGFFSFLFVRIRVWRANLYFFFRLQE